MKHHLTFLNPDFKKIYKNFIEALTSIYKCSTEMFDWNYKQEDLIVVKLINYKSRGY